MKIDENGYKIYTIQRNGHACFSVVAPTGENLGEFTRIDSCDAPIARHLRKQQGKDRPCMNCEKTFRSSWIGNRLCKTCCTISEGMV